MERIRISWRQTVLVMAALVLAFGLAGCEMITGALNGGGDNGGGTKAEPVLTVSLPTVSISVGTFKSIKVTAKDKNGNLEWFTADSSADGVAKVQNETATSFEIKGIAPGSATIFLTSASNKNVSISVSVAALASGPPVTPAALAVSNITSSTVDLTWSTADDATTWDVQKAVNATPLVWNSAGAATTSPAYTVTGLAPNTDYQFRVKANNSSGSSAWTTGVPAKTTATSQVTTITGKPTVSLGLVTSSSIQIQWTGVPGATKYEVQAVTSTGGNLGLVIDNFNGLNFNVSGLAADTSYSYQVRGKNDAGAAGPWSNTFTARTSITQSSGGSAPTVQPVLSIGLIGPDYVQVRWTSVPTATNYDLYYGYASGTTMVWVGPYTFGSQLTETTLTSLSSNTTYNFKMVAWNGQGQGPASVIKSAATTAPVTQPTNTPPLAPSGLFVSLNGSQAYLTWYASYGALGYNVFRLDPGAVSYTYVGWTDQYSTYFQDPSNLLPGKQYQYKVNAFNASPMPSGDSNIASIFTPNATTGTGPAAPNAYSYSSAGTDYYEVDWNPDPNVVRYDVEVSTDGINWTFYATPYYAYVYYYGPTGTGMLPDTTYQFRVKAWDSLNRTSLSNVLTYKTPAAAAPVPVVIHIN